MNRRLKMVGWVAAATMVFAGVSYVAAAWQRILHFESNYELYVDEERSIFVDRQHVEPRYLGSGQQVLMVIDGVLGPANEVGEEDSIAYAIWDYRSTEEYGAQQLSSDVAEYCRSSGQVANAAVGAMRYAWGVEKNSVNKVPCDRSISFTKIDFGWLICRKGENIGRTPVGKVCISCIDMALGVPEKTIQLWLANAYQDSQSASRQAKQARDALQARLIIK
jgi:hypothetical protein